MPSHVSRVARRHDGDDSLHSRDSRLHFSVCLWRRRPSSVASLVITTAWWIARAPLALACRLTPPAPSRTPRVARRHDGDDSLHSRDLRLHLSVCLWRRRPSSVASLFIATAWWIARAPPTLACRLTPPAPSRTPRVAHRHDGDDSLRSRIIRGCILACASRAVDLRLLRSSSRRRGGLLAHPSRSRIDSRLPRRRASLTLLVVTTVMIRCILAISRLYLGVCLWRRRPSSVPSLVIATARWIALAPLALACRLAPPAPSRVSRVAPRHDGDDSLYSRAIRSCISAYASGAVDLRLLRSSSRRHC